MSKNLGFQHESLETQYRDYAIKNQMVLNETNVNAWPIRIKKEVSDIYNRTQIANGMRALPFIEGQLYEPGEIVFCEDTKKHYIAKMESIAVTPGISKNWQNYWNEYKIVNFSVINSENLLFLDGSNKKMPEVDFAPTPKIYVDNLHNKLTDDPNLKDKKTDPNKVSVFNSARLGGFFASDYVKQTELNSLDSKTLKTAQLVKTFDEKIDPNIKNENAPLSAILGDNLNERTKLVENFIDIKNYTDINNKKPYINKTGSVVYNSLGEILDKIHNSFAEIKNLPITNVVGLKVALKEITDNISKLIEKTTFSNSIDLRDNTTNTINKEKLIGLSTSFGRFLYKQIVDIQTKLDTGDLSLENIRDVITLIKDNANIIDEMKKAGVGLRADYNSLRTLIDNHINNFNYTKTDLEKKIFNLDFDFNQLTSRFNYPINETIITWTQLLDELRRIDKAVVNNLNYTKSELGKKADKINTYTKTEVYNKTETYSKSEVFNKVESYDRKYIDSVINNLKNTKLDTTTANSNFLSRNKSDFPTSDNMFNLGDGTHRWKSIYAVEFNGTALRARYADLAEFYDSDTNYEIGTILAVGGEKEVTKYKKGMTLAGIVSENPGFILNNNSDFENPALIALKGRVKVKVKGCVLKGQYVNAFDDGYGIASNFKDETTVGVCLENSHNYDFSYVLVKV